MRRILIVVVFAALLAPSWSAAAEVVDCKRACKPPHPDDLQFDGDAHGDAADMCEQAYQSVPRPGQRGGSLAAPLDVSDHYLVNLTAGVTTTMTLFSYLDLRPAVWPANALAEIDFRLREPTCSSVVAYGSEGGVSLISTSSDFLTYTPTVTGHHVVEIYFKSGTALVPTVSTCNPVCSRAFNGVGGYTLYVS